MHNMEQRVRCLENASEPSHSLAERIDRDMTRAAQKAAKAAATKHKIPWSPKLARAWATIHLYKMVKSQIKIPDLQLGNSIREWQKNHDGLPTTLPTSLQEVEKKIERDIF